MFTLTGRVHFDDDEIFTIDDFRGTDLLQTAAHEFGHSLGLSHSDDKKALMAPFYRGYTPNLELNQDDIDAIQSLYGIPKATLKPPETEKPTNDYDYDTINNEELCSEGEIDDIFGTKDNNYYVFKGSNYWLLSNDR